MLRGPAQDYYFNTIHNFPQIQFLPLCQAFRDHFEGEELRRNVLDEWNSLTLQQTKNMNTEKSFQACFDLMLQKLRALHYGLRKELRNDYFLHIKTITACKSVEACSYTYSKPSESVTGLINDIRSSISTWESCHPALNTNSRFPDINFVDRKFRYQTHLYRPHMKNSFRDSRKTDSQNKNKKRCIICHKKGCWSSNHNKDELDEAKANTSKEWADYVLQLTTENLDDSQIFMEQLENLVLEPQTDTEIQTESDSTSSSIFLTSVGPLDGDIFVQNLTNKSFTHAL
ncbi:hypothetical protein GcM3_084026, partial [Golovinomyces cichoracearum]